MSTVVMLRQGLSVPADPRVWREATALAEAGHDITVVAPRAAGQRRAEVLDGVRIRRYPYRAGASLPGFVVETVGAFAFCAAHLLRCRLRGRIDVLHVFNPPDTLALLALLVPSAHLVYDQADPVPELLAARGGAPRPVPQVLGRLERWVLRRAALVLTVNGTCRLLATQRGARSERVVVLRIGPRSVHAGAEQGSGQPVVAFAGVVGPQDGVDVFLRAAAAVLRLAPGSARFSVIGDGPAIPEMHRLAEQLGIAADVTWTGWLSGAEFRAHLSEADLCVSPDADTDFNRLATMVKITDYLAAGRPVVAADLPETRITCAGAATYFRPGDSDDLAATVRRLVADPAERAELRQRARDRAPALLWQHSADRLVAAYAWLLAGGPAIAGEHVP